MATDLRAAVADYAAWLEAEASHPLNAPRYRATRAGMRTARARFREVAALATQPPTTPPDGVQPDGHVIVHVAACVPCNGPGEPMGVNLLDPDDTWTRDEDDEL